MLRSMSGFGTARAVIDRFVRNFTSDVSGGGDAANEVFLLGLAFGSYGEGIEEAQRERILDGFILTVAKVALAENFHADHRFARSLHFAQSGDYGRGIRVHVGAD